MRTNDMYDPVLSQKGTEYATRSNGGQAVFRYGGPPTQAPSVEMREYETGVRHQWIAPLLSVTTCLMIVVNLSIGIGLTWVEDQINGKTISSDQLQFIELMLSVTIALHIQSLRERYTEAQKYIETITCNTAGQSGEEIAKHLKSYIEQKADTSIPSKMSYDSEFDYIVDTTKSDGEKYTAFRSLVMTIWDSENQGLSTLIWWQVNVLCSICVPSSMNDETSTDDYGWLVSSLVIQVFAWSTLGIAYQYLDVLRPVQVWVYPMSWFSNVTKRQ